MSLTSVFPDSGYSADPNYDAPPYAPAYDEGAEEYYETVTKPPVSVVYPFRFSKGLCPKLIG